MTINEGGRLGISQDEYERSIPLRLMPEAITVSLNGILRMLMPTRSQPPYAFEFFGIILEIEEDKRPAWNQVLVVDCDRPKGIARFPLNLEGFIVTPNTGPTRDVERPEGIIEVGYLLGTTSLPDAELSQVADTAVPSI